VLKRITVIHV